MNYPFWAIISFRVINSNLVKNVQDNKILTMLLVTVTFNFFFFFLCTYAWCFCMFFWFSQDSFGRLHDRGKEVPKATKLLTKLFPNKVTIHMPQVYEKEQPWFIISLFWRSILNCPFIMAGWGPSCVMETPVRTRCWNSQNEGKSESIARCKHFPLLIKFWTNRCIGLVDVVL